MRRPFISSLIVNFAIFQFLGMVIVGEASQGAFRQWTVLESAGFFPLPPQPDISLAATAAAALFYCLTMGAGFTVLEWLCAKILTVFFSSTRVRYLLFAAAACALLIYVTAVFSTPYVYGICVALSLVLAGFIFLHPRAGEGRAPSKYSKPSMAGTLIVMVTVLAALFLTGARDFISFRDLIMLSNPVGRFLSDVYYRNTVNAIRPLESLNRKAWVIVVTEDERIPAGKFQVFRRNLLRQGIFLLSSDSLSDKKAADLHLEMEDGKLYLTRMESPGIRVAAVPSVGRAVMEVSEILDGAAPLRQLLAIFVALLCPLLTLFVFARIVMWIWAVTLGRMLPSTLSLGVVILMALTLLVLAFLGPGSPLPPDARRLAAIARSGDSFQRVRAARKLAELAQGEEAEEALLEMARNNDFRTRTWAALGLGKYSGPKAAEALSSLTADPHITVVTACVSALWKRTAAESRKALTELCLRKEPSYSAYKAFRAVKDRGWLEIR